MTYLIIFICILATLFLPNPFWIPFYLVAFLVILNKLVRI